jgi:hypothetical protein
MEETKQREETKAPVPAAAVDQVKLIAKLQRRLQMNNQAYKSGEKAKRFSWARLSPFYDDPIADAFFFAGFDGIPWMKAIRGEFDS